MSIDTAAANSFRYYCNYHIHVHWYIIQGKVYKYMYIHTSKSAYQQECIASYTYMYM